jgi:hypothetical protein
MINKPLNSEKGQMKPNAPEKVTLLERLKEGNFDVPDFVYVPATDFKQREFGALEAFLTKHRESFKVIARSAHPQEAFFKGGTFDSLETYADIGGIEYARKKMIKSAKTAKRLSILRQQKFSNAPQIDVEEMGVMVMPFIDGSNVMAKVVGEQWEFGYCHERTHKVESEPYITRTPHDTKLLEMSEDIQKHLGFRCEIEYVISGDGTIYVVQAKDISNIETVDLSIQGCIRLDGIRRIRKRRNYRERPVYVMNNKDLYIAVISKCEDILHGCEGPTPDIQDAIEIINSYQAQLEEFALRHERFAVLGLSIQEPKELYQIANHYLNETPELQKPLSKALHENLIQIDYFLSQTDTLIAKNKIRFNVCSHDAYGIDTVRNPLWSLYWYIDKHDQMVKEFKRLGFETGDSISIDIDPEGKPIVCRL